MKEKPTAGDTKNIDDISLTGMNLVGDEAVVSSWPIYDDMEAAFDQGQLNIYFTYLLGTFSL